MLQTLPQTASRNLEVVRRSDGRASRADRAATTLSVPVYEAELWTSRQRQASSIHEISYRACFKPQLPGYFIERLTREGDVVYDPFSGRGTTAIEAALRGRSVIANDVNPLSAMLTQPRFELPGLADIDARLRTLKFTARPRSGLDLSMFFHPDTEYEILGLREYLYRRVRSGEEDAVDRWIRMVATNRLTGHSPGFFSVYTLPPNQAVSPEDQLRINARLRQEPDYRDIRALIRRKSMQLQSRLGAGERWRLRAAAARRPPAAEGGGRDAGDRLRQRAIDRHVAAVPRCRPVRARQLAALLVQRARRGGDRRPHHDEPDRGGMGAGDERGVRRALPGHPAGRMGCVRGG